MIRCKSYKTNWNKIHSQLWIKEKMKFIIIVIFLIIGNKRILYNGYNLLIIDM